MKKRNYQSPEFQNAMQNDRYYNLFVIVLPVLGFFFLLLGVFSLIAKPENPENISTVPTWVYFALTGATWFVGQKIRRHKYDKWLRRRK